MPPQISHGEPQSGAIERGATRRRVRHRGADAVRGCALALSFSLACGCDTSTSVTYHVDADDVVRAAAGSLRLHLSADGATLYEERREATEFSWPAALRVTRRNHDETTLVAEAELEDGRVVAITARARFVSAESRHVWLTLTDACVDVDCGAGARTCWDGLCTDACFVASRSPPTAPIACERSDAGVDVDAGGCVELDPCAGGNGTCHRGACCTGCWDGERCVEPTDAAQCGRAGADCVACECEGDLCVAGTCAPPPERAADVVSTWWHRTCASGPATMWCWGADDFGQVGDGAPSGIRPPTAIGPFGRFEVRGPGHTSALDAQHHRWSWGENTMGESLDPESTTNIEAPVEANDGIEWSHIAAGYRFTCGRDQTSAVYCWGSNLNGTLGVDPATLPSSATPVRVTYLAQRVTVGLHTAFAIVGGSLRGWGSNSRSQLARPAGSAMYTPVTIDLGEPAVNVWSGFHFACALGDSGRLYCWGGDGEWLGPRDGTLEAYQPGPIPDAAGAVWETASVGDDHACAIDSDGHLACWGRNAVGQLGDGTLTSQLMPERIAGDTEWRSISLGPQTTCGVTSSHIVMCWGQNDVGVLGFDGASSRTPRRVCLPAP